MRVISTALLLLAAVLLLPNPAHAQPSPTLSTVQSAGGNVLMSPGGIAPALGTPGTTIWVTVLDNAGNPINGLPAGAFEVESANPATMSDCFFPAGPAHDVRPGGFAQVSPGVYTLSGPLYAGGHAFNGFLVRVLGVQIIPGVPTSHWAVSPDIFPDGVINLVDVGILAMAFGGYDPRCDFDFNGTVNLADVGTFAMHYGETFPPGGVLDPVD